MNGVCAIQKRGHRSCSAALGHGRTSADLLDCARCPRVSTLDEQNLVFGVRCQSRDAAVLGTEFVVRCGGGLLRPRQRVIRGEDAEEMLDWIGDDFDPQAFSVDKVNRLLTPLRRRGKAPKS